MRETPFDYLHHLVTVPVRLNGHERRFVLDSGIGLTLVRDTIGGIAATGGSFTGRRMSGQDVTSPLGIAPLLEFAGISQRDAEVGLIDVSGFPPELAALDGFLSLAFFIDQPFTVDYASRTIRDGSDADGFVIPVSVVRDGPSVDVFMSLTIPGGRSISVEVDMGSESLILDERFAAEVGIELDGDRVRRVEGKDETGTSFVRSFTRLKGHIYPTAAPDLAVRDPEAMFQRIIHDGLVGHAFLRHFLVTWNIAASHIVLAPCSTPGGLRGARSGVRESLAVIGFGNARTDQALTNSPPEAGP